MSTISRPEAGDRASAARPRRNPLPPVLLAACFVLAVFPGFHWALGSAASAMTYLVGAAAFICVAIVAAYFVDRPARGEQSRGEAIPEESQ
jgi:hypothetical protein